MLSNAAILSSAGAGIAAHLLLFIRGEWHQKVPSIVYSHASAFALLWLVLCQSGLAVEHAGLHSLVAFITYSSALFASIIIYRLFFHPLRHFPGPILARVSKFWHVFNILDTRNHEFLRELHRQYGKIVRIGPNELAIFDASAHELIDGAKSGTIKDEFYDVLQPNYSTVFVRDKAVNKALRRTWDNALSAASLRVYAPRVFEQVRSLTECITQYKEQPVNVSEVMAWFAFDTMGSVVFGDDFGMLKARETQSILEDQKATLALFGRLRDVFWLVKGLITVAPSVWVLEAYARTFHFCCSRMDRKLQESTVEGAQKDPGPKSDMASWFVEEYHDAPHHGLNRRKILEGNAVSAIVAGSDTTRAGLIGVVYYLCKYPEHIAQILEEIERSDVNNASELALLPHLNGFINEVMRLMPPALTGGGRVAGEHGLKFNDVHIPPGTMLTAPKFVISRLGDAFEKPDDFIPERWTSKPELIYQRSAHAPFTVGPHQCIGKGLAMMEIRAVAAHLVQRFVVDFSEDYDPETLWRDLRDQVTAQPGALWCTFRER